MAQVRVLLMPSFLRRDIIMVGETQVPIIKQHLDRFLMLPPVEVAAPARSENAEDSRLGEELAEEIFNLTNNPGRQDERMERYGNGQSLSVGDVVRTPFGDFLCMCVGWKKL